MADQASWIGKAWLKKFSSIWRNLIFLIVHLTQIILFLIEKSNSNKLKEICINIWILSFLKILKRKVINQRKYQ